MKIPLMVLSGINRKTRHPGIFLVTVKEETNMNTTNDCVIINATAEKNASIRTPISIGGKETLWKELDNLK